MLTQLSRYARIKKMDVRKLRIEQVNRFFMRGSFLAGTACGGGLDMETRIHVESDEAPQVIQDLIRTGERTCFTFQSLVNALPAHTRVTLNGSELPMEEDAG